jgi:ADP-ribosylglycohydrolase
VVPEVADRIRGTIFGQAVGDALGFGAEFLSRTDVERHYPDGLRRYSQITRFPPNPFWQPGDWTDDTDQMLCILDSLLAQGALDLRDIAARLRHWALADGYGMGSTVYAMVRHPSFLEEPHEAARQYWESSGRQSASNGAVMRTSVLGIWAYPDEGRVRHHAEQACRLTHADPRCIASCVAVCLAIRRLLCGARDMRGLVADVLADVRHLHPEVETYFHLAGGPSLGPLDLDEGMSPGEENRQGYTLKTLAAAFWALQHSERFEEGILAIIREGGDADTNAAVAGALLGARFGFTAVPAEWREGLFHQRELEERVERLIARCSPEESGGGG